MFISGYANTENVFYCLNTSISVNNFLFRHWKTQEVFITLFIFFFIKQVQSLTALVGKAFQVAFAESKFPQGAELKMNPIQRTSPEDRVVQGRRWVSIYCR